MTSPSCDFSTAKPSRKLGPPGATSTGGGGLGGGGGAGGAKGTLLADSSGVLVGVGVARRCWLGGCGVGVSVGGRSVGTGVGVLVGFGVGVLVGGLVGVLVAGFGVGVLVGGLVAVGGRVAVRVAVGSGGSTRGAPAAPLKPTSSTRSRPSATAISALIAHLAARTAPWSALAVELVAAWAQGQRAAALAPLRRLPDLADSAQPWWL